MTDEELFWQMHKKQNKYSSTYQIDKGKVIVNHEGQDVKNIALKEFRFRSRKQPASFSINEEAYLLDLFNAFTSASFERVVNFWIISKRVKLKTSASFELTRYKDVIVLAPLGFNKLEEIIAVYENIEDLQKRLVGDLRCLNW